MYYLYFVFENFVLSAYLKAVESGHLRLIPEHYEKQWKDWLSNTRLSAIFIIYYCLYLFYYWFDIFILLLWLVSFENIWIVRYLLSVRIDAFCFNGLHSSLSSLLSASPLIALPYAWASYNHWAIVAFFWPTTLVFVIPFSIYPFSHLYITSVGIELPVMIFIDVVFLLFPLVSDILFLRLSDEIGISIHCFPVSVIWCLCTAFTILTILSKSLFGIII